MALVFRVMSFDSNKLDSSRIETHYEAQPLYVDVTIGDEPAHIIKINQQKALA